MTTSQLLKRIINVNRFYLVSMAALLPLISSAQAAEPLVLVANPTSHINSLKREEVAALFMGVKRSIGSTEVIVLDLDDEEIRQEFYNQVAHRSLIQMRAYWAKMVFTGNGRPPMSLSLDKLMEKLRDDPNVIGYLPTSKSNEFKILLTIPHY